MQRIAIVGGGTAGWMTAAAFCNAFADVPIEIILVESEQIGSVGVGEATIPHLRYFNERLGINEHEFMRRTQATYKLGIEFTDWGKQSHHYIHPFAEFGFNTQGVPFYHYWLKARRAGYEHCLDDFCFAAGMAKGGKFSYPATTHPLHSTYSYAFHLDASLYAALLREYCERTNGKRARFRRIEGKINEVQQNHDSGDIEAVTLISGERLCADFFIDCSGFRSLLLGATLNTAFEDWSTWLPCDRALAVPTASEDSPTPYTKAIARGVGWQWQIPLQHRVGNGLVYSSQFLGDDEAEARLRQNLQGPLLADVRPLKFRTGRHQFSWQKNCAAVGLSAGFLEPLESTGIYLIQAAIMKLIDLLPADMDYAVPRAEFNQQMAVEYERVRDFLILHYHATEREDTAFWTYCKNMSVPDSLQLKIDVFRDCGYIANSDRGLFLEPSWTAVLLGQGIYPQQHHLAVDHMDCSALKKQLDIFRQEIAAEVARMPNHQDVLAKHCAKDTQEPWPGAAMNLYGVFS